MMRIGELAKKVGITTQAIRYYERVGLFENPARNSSGYRIYEDHAVDFLKFVKKAQSLGFNLQEIKTIWNIVSSGKKPCGYVLKQTENRLREVDKRMEDLQELRLLLLNILKQRRLLNILPDDSCTICPLIEAADKD
jgi:MerR family mercuric resistance operon transcriptional regulator